MRDLHMHTVFSDGKNTPEEMVEAAIALGMDAVGISDHAYTPGDECCMPPDRRKEYRRELRRLREKYAGAIDVRCGLERDLFSDDFEPCDYAIGSVHFLRMRDGHPVVVDWDTERLRADVETYFHGDWYGLAEEYFAAVSRVVEVTRCDIIGHFDLLTRNNERHALFDTNHPRYIRAWQAAADALLKTGAAFEINTGAIARGYRTAPYPAPDIAAYLKERGAVMLLSSDAHRKEDIGYQFEKWSALL